MNTALPKKTKPAPPANQLEIRQMVTAMALNVADDTTLDYLAFLTGLIPVRAAFFLHVQPRLDLLNALFEREAQSVVSNFDFHTDLIRQMETTVRSRFDQYSATRVETDVREGNPLEEILRESEDLQADLVVAGKSSAGTVHGILAGNLVRKTRCNTLIVPDKAVPKLERILVPVDFSPYSIRALKIAEALALQLPETVEIVVTHQYDLPSIMPFLINKTQEDLQHIMVADRRAALEDFLLNFAPKIAARCRLVVGRHDGASVAEQILQIATEEQADLIIMGAKGHSKVELLLMGSVTESLLHIDNSVPVWVVK